DLIERGCAIFDRVVVAVADSARKQPLFDLEERLTLCKQALTHVDNVDVQGFSGLLVEFARKHASCFVLRGVRAVADYEYELQLANMNRAMMPELETVFLTPAVHLSYVSSSLVREIAAMGGDITRFVPSNVAAALVERVQHD